MDERTICSADYAAHRPLLTVWLPRLFLCQIAATVMTALSSISSIGAVITWIARVLAIVSIVILFQLSPAHKRYRKSAIFRCIVFVGTLLSLLIVTAVIIGLQNFPGTGIPCLTGRSLAV